MLFGNRYRKYYIFLRETNKEKKNHLWSVYKYRFQNSSSKIKIQVQIQIQVKNESQNVHINKQLPQVASEKKGNNSANLTTKMVLDRFGVVHRIQQQAEEPGFAKDRCYKAQAI